MRKAVGSEESGVKREIISPIDDETIASLHAGDRVALSGVVYTARDLAHKRFAELLDAKQELPVNLRGQTIYYAGPAPARPGRVIGSVGPTTGSRMDPFTPALLAYGVKILIGKGARSPAIRKAIARYGAVYLVGVGGAAAYLSEFVVGASVAAFPELGPEAVFKLEVEGLPLFVGIDSEGRSCLWPDVS